ncbi:hypothetical protein [Acaryochloris sp. IP29b_bin.137]|uniref:hypothetical protein n=1 Tax=Acaryochloris sp. IP29b_bin.137 TaxID=2969217 RepID=UPI0026225598|nr:hypothetical protein [Acaryochloris sp. IP29b_bin.137]
MQQHNPSHHANQAWFKSLHHQWQRQDRQRQILRSQVGFGVALEKVNGVCHTCANYHGKTYGMSKENRSVLVCAIHPFGWDLNAHCPDWCSFGPESEPGGPEA